MFICSLIHYQTTNFRLFQIERLCRRQFKICRKWQKVIQTGRKHCGKRRNCSLRAISPFPTVFSKACFPGASKGVIVWEWVKPLRHNKTFRPVYILNVIKDNQVNTAQMTALCHLKDGKHFGKSKSKIASADTGRYFIASTPISQNIIRFHIAGNV